ncbi:MAG: hypothetical protein EKK62_17065 [Acidimicrobiia bacterium]|nr:MAG: hypothetical protein EKK62_17065 [Acidimicrobiia bacterium]
MKEDRVALVKYLRSSARYHRHRQTPVIVSWRALTTLRAAGVMLELPASGYPGELTPDQAERYAAQLEGAAHG